MDWNGNAKYYKDKQHESHESHSKFAEECDAVA